MSREQRRAQKKQQARQSAAPQQSGGASSGVQRRGTPAPVSRRTPVRAPSAAGFRWLPVVVVGGVAAMVALVAYLIYQSQSDGGVAAHVKAEWNSDPALPGIWVPTQGRGHHRGTWTYQNPIITPFCEGVEASDEANASPTAAGTPDGSASATSTATTTPTATATATPSPQATEAQTERTPPSPTAVTGCYASNPPTSGEHIGVQQNVEVAPGIFFNRIPPDPNVYEPDVPIPRDAIPHILEHAGVFVGYNCPDGDAACEQVVQDLEDLVNDRIDNHDDRVVMAFYPDLPEGEIGVASWTRYMRFPYQEYNEDAVRDFIGTNSCRFDPEGFCK